LASLGSVISVFSFLVFIYLLYNSFVSDNSKTLCINKFKNNIILFFTFILDAPYENQILFQDPATSVMNAMIDLHHDIMTILIFIILFVL
jgi:hypothetical protein